MKSFVAVVLIWLIVQYNVLGSFLSAQRNAVKLVLATNNDKHRSDADLKKGIAKFYDEVCLKLHFPY